jgi:hypothetical protein
MGKIDVGPGPAGRYFCAYAISCVRDGGMLVKLTLCRNSRLSPEYQDLRLTD